MVKLIKLFENPSPWIMELDKRALYNAPIVDERGVYYYVYCWVNLDTQWCYVGYHTSVTYNNLENYLGSSGNPHYWRSRELHKYECFILGYTTDRESGYELESKIIDKYMIDQYSNNGLFNLMPGGINGCVMPGAKALLSYNIDKQFASINKHINYIKFKYGKLTPYNYAFNNYDGFDCRRQHIKGVIKRMDYLLNDNRWTNEMSELFSHFRPMDPTDRTGLIMIVK